MFDTEVRSVTGDEAEWLRRELAAVLCDLLRWANEDIATAGDDEGSWAA
ncbi:hypothetical protein [Amycolatopsis albispora]|nr:hypothetical protein [Amycolatopsis albispora]